MTEYPVYRLPFPHDPLAEVAKGVYNPIKNGEQDYGERRKLVAEAFNSSENIESLVSIFIRFLVKSYNGGPLQASFTKTNRILFGELLDTELPIETVVLLDVRIFTTMLSIALFLCASITTAGILN